MNDFKNYYRVLGVDITADGMAIKAAFRRLALRHHPDRNTTARAAGRFQEIREAYEVLSDPDKRRDYDRVYRAQTAPRPVRRRDDRPTAARPRSGSAGLGITLDLLGLRLGLAIDAGTARAARLPRQRKKR